MAKPAVAPQVTIFPPQAAAAMNVLAPPEQRGRALPDGVCHRLVVESYARPGDVIVLTDSHTPTAGAPLADFEPVTMLGRYPFALDVNPKLPAKTVKELVELARKSPGKLNFGSIGALMRMGRQGNKPA